mgnify:FL=1
MVGGFPPQSSENRQEERRQARARRPVPPEEWQEEESAQAKTIQPEPEQQQPVQPLIPEATPVLQTTSVPVSPPIEPIPKCAPMEQTKPSQRRP